MPVLEESIAEGRVVYHADRMGACLDVMASQTCLERATAMEDDFVGTGCEDPFEGQVALDGTCAQDWDCVSEYCSGAATDFEGNITYGVCATAPPVGQPCDDDECASGAYCENGPTPTCQAVLADGSECTFDDDCASGSCEANVCGAPTSCDGVE